MNDFFTQIENEYSRARGKASFIAPLDWQLVQDWEKEEIPLPIILRAMGDVVKKFQVQNRKVTINTLRYFAPEIENNLPNGNKAKSVDQTARMPD